MLRGYILFQQVLAELKHPAGGFVVGCSQVAGCVHMVRLRVLLTQRVGRVSQIYVICH